MAMRWKVGERASMVVDGRTDWIELRETESGRYFNLYMTPETENLTLPELGEAGRLAVVGQPILMERLMAMEVSSESRIPCWVDDSWVAVPVKRTR